MCTRKDARPAWLDSLVLSRKQSDVELVVGEEAVIPAHSLVLRAQSEVLAAMLDNQGFREGQTRKIKLSCGPRTLEYFLRYLYTGCLPDVIPVSEVLELLKLSHQYQVQSLLSASADKLSWNPPVNMVCEIYHVAALLESKQLKEACFRSISEYRIFIETNHLHFDMSKHDIETVIKPPLKLDSHSVKWSACLKGEPWSSEEVATETLEHVDSMYLDASYCDMELHLGKDSPEVFPAHSVILARQSPVFKSLWKERTCTPCRITLTSIDARVLEYFLRYLYFQRLQHDQISETNLMCLLRVSCEYKVQALTSTCVKTLTDIMTDANCCQILALAEALNLPELKQVAVDKVAKNWETVTNNHLHFVLCQVLMIEVISKITGTHNCKEQTILVIRDWAKWRCCLDNSSRMEDFQEPVLGLALGLKVVILAKKTEINPYFHNFIQMKELKRDLRMSTL